VTWEEAVVGSFHSSVTEEAGMDSPARAHGCCAVFLISGLRLRFKGLGLGSRIQVEGFKF
jgi:hypothetical protein